MVQQNRVVRKKLKELRKLRGTQEQVGRDNGVTGTTIRNIENGHTVPSLKLMLRLSDYFGVPVFELFSDVIKK